MRIVSDEQYVELQVDCDMALNHLITSITGKVYDSSWIRPVTVSKKEQRESAAQALSFLNRLKDRIEKLGNDHT